MKGLETWSTPAYYPMPFLNSFFLNAYVLLGAGLLWAIWSIKQARNDFRERSTHGAQPVPGGAPGSYQWSFNEQNTVREMAADGAAGASRWTLWGWALLSPGEAALFSVCGIFKSFLRVYGLLYSKAWVFLSECCCCTVCCVRCRLCAPRLQPHCFKGPMRGLPCEMSAATRTRVPL